MEARIVVAEGLLGGRSFPLGGDPFSIGRGANNHLDIPDPEISAEHCVIHPAREHSLFELEDRDSLNGTYVNNVKVAKAVLSHGDRISIGASILLFQAAEDGAELVQFDESLPDNQSTLELSPSDLSPGRAAASLPPWTPVEAHLELLLKIAASLQSSLGVRSIQNKVLEFLFEALPCDRGTMLLTASSQAAPQSAAGWTRPSGPCAPPPMSRAIFKRVIDEGKAVLSRETKEDAAFSGSDSLARSGARSILAVPLTASDRRIGLIYLQSSSAADAFDTDHLRLLTAVGAIVGLAVENAQRLEWVESENHRLEQEVRVDRNLVGESSTIVQVYQQIKRVAPTQCTVLILGESGTGKELAARAIHRSSERSGQPFIPVNCAVFSDTLLESDLFGHEKGSFTGAIARKQGKLEIADRGTLFLDEVGELALHLQAKLLRVLQEREFERVGGLRPIQVDVRIIAATNRNLLEEVSNGGFRQDLYYRLNVVAVTMPALRDRRDDIPLLAECFLSRSVARIKRRLRGISPEALKCLTQYSWPGNVRELENAIERAVVLGSSDWILPEDLPEEVTSTITPGETSPTLYHQGLRHAKRELVLKSLEEAGGNYPEAARILGVHITYLYRLIRNLNLST
jgi:Nif-specific regulatory protein